MKTKIIPWFMTLDVIVLYKVYKKAHDHTTKMYMKNSIIKKTMESISFDYRRGVEDTRDQIPKLCNTVEPKEMPEETKVDNSKQGII